MTGAAVDTSINGFSVRASCVDRLHDDVSKTVRKRQNIFMKFDISQFEWRERPEWHDGLADPGRGRLHPALERL
jgi:hypothetical protein